MDLGLTDVSQCLHWTETQTVHRERETNTYVIHSFDYLLKLSGASHQATAAALMRQSKQTPPVSEKVR